MIFAEPRCKITNGLPGGLKGQGRKLRCGMFFGLGCGITLGRLIFVGQTLWGGGFLIKLNLVSGCVCLCFVLLVCSPVEKSCLSKLGSNLPVSGCSLTCWSTSFPVFSSDTFSWIIQMTYSSQNTTKKTRILLPHPSFNVPWKRDHFQKEVTCLPTIMFEGQAVVVFFWGGGGKLT